MLFFLISFLIFATLCFYVIFAYRYDKSYVIQRRVEAYFYPGRTNLEELPEEDLSFAQRVLLPGWKNIKRKYRKRLSRERASQLERKLMQAGQPFGWSPVEFQLFQYILIIVLPLGTGGLLLLLQQPVLNTLLLALAAAVAGFILPRYYISKRINNRIQKALRELPDTLDLLTISLEAGLGFDAALSKVVSRKHGVLADEFRICLDELRIGRTRKDALQGITERLSFDELNAFVYNVIQAEKLGIGMVSVLKIQAEDVREKRRQRAEEAAMKAPVKMLFPLVLFIFPTLFIILLGPALLQFLESF